MVILEAPIIYMLRYMGVWSEGRAELEFSITPELVAGVSGILSKMDFKLHKRLKPMLGLDDCMIVYIEFDLVGCRGLRGYYGALGLGDWYRGVRRIGDVEGVDVKSLFSKLYDYGMGIGAFEHIAFGVSASYDARGEFSWLPIMVVLGRLGVVRGTRWGSMELNLIYKCGDTGHIGGGLYRIAGWDFYRSDGRFYDEDMRRYKPIADGLLRYELEDMYRDIWGFWRDFSW